MIPQPRNEAIWRPRSQDTGMYSDMNNDDAGREKAGIRYPTTEFRRQRIQPLFEKIKKLVGKAGGIDVTMSEEKRFEKHRFVPDWIIRFSYIPHEPRYRVGETKFWARLLRNAVVRIRTNDENTGFEICDERYEDIWPQPHTAEEFYVQKKSSRKLAACFNIYNENKPSDNRSKNPLEALEFAEKLLGYAPRTETEILRDVRQCLHDHDLSAKADRKKRRRDSFILSGLISAFIATGVSIVYTSTSANAEMFRNSQPFKHPAPAPAQE